MLNSFKGAHHDREEKQACISFIPRLISIEVAFLPFHLKAS